MKRYIIVVVGWFCHSLYSVNTIHDFLIMVQDSSFSGYSAVIDVIQQAPWLLTSQDSLSNNMTPLMAAIKVKNSSIFALLLTQDSVIEEINQVDNDGWSALTYAVCQGNIDYIKDLLLIKNIQYDQMDFQGNTLLMHAVRSLNVEVFYQICALQDKFLLDCANNQGDTALYISYTLRNKEMFLKLLQEGALLDGSDFNLSGLAIWLVQERFPVEIILRCIQLGIEINEPDQQGKTAVMWALELGFSEIVQLLITVKNSAGVSLVDFTVQDNQGNTLWYYIKNSSVSVFQLALKLIAGSVIVDNAVNLKTYWLIKNRIALSYVTALFNVGLLSSESSLYQGMTPYLYAVYTQNIDMIDYFLTLSSDSYLLQAGTIGKNGLLLAIETGNLTIVQKLLQATNDNGGPLYNVNAAGTNGLKPLMVAVQKGNVAVVNALLSSGADPSDQDSLGNSVLMYAVQAGNIDIVSAIASVLTLNQINAVNKEFNTALMFAASKATADSLLLLLSKGALYNSANKLGLTPLMIAASSGSYVVLRALLQYVFNTFGRNKAIYYTNMQDLNLKTALMYAVEKDSADSISDLVDYGAMVNIQDAFNKTALMYAVEKNKINNVKYLVARGADVDAQAYDGSTAMSIARFKNYFAIISYLARLLTLYPAAPAQSGNIGAYFKTLAIALGQSDSWIAANYYKTNQAQYELFYAINRVFAHAFALYCQNVIEIA